MHISRKRVNCVPRVRINTQGEMVRAKRRFVGPNMTLLVPTSMCKARYLSVMVRHVKNSGVLIYYLICANSHCFLFLGYYYVNQGECGF